MEKNYIVHFVSGKTKEVTSYVAKQLIDAISKYNDLPKVFNFFDDDKILYFSFILNNIEYIEIKKDEK